MLPPMTGSFYTLHSRGEREWGIGRQIGILSLSLCLLPYTVVLVSYNCRVLYCCVVSFSHIPAEATRKMPTAYCNRLLLLVFEQMMK